MKVVKVSESKVVAEVMDEGSVMEEIATAMWVKANEAFEDQGRGGQSWPGRMTPNVAAIVKRLNAGKNPRDQDFEPKIALRDTGHLLNSLTPRWGKNFAEVGTVNADYATKMQEGGPSEIVLTPAGRKRLSTWIRQNRDKGEEIGWLFGKPKLTINVIPRKFLMVTDDDLAEFSEIVAKHIEGKS